MKIKLFWKLAVAMFCGIMMPLFTSCSSDNDNSGNDKNPVGVQAKYYVSIDKETFEGYFFEIEYTNNNGQVEKEIVDNATTFEKGALIKNVPVTVELKVEAKPRDKNTLSKEKYNCLFTFGLGAAPVNSKGEVIGTISVEPQVIQQYGIKVDNMKSINRRMVVSVDKDGKIVK